MATAAEDARRRRPERPRRPPEAASGASGPAPTARRATRSSPTSCSTGSRPRSSSRRSTGATRSGSARSAPRCCLLLVVSGLPLLFLYVPSVERAYGSVKDIEWVVTFGSWIRSVHRLSAHLMVAAVFLHLVRVFLTGAYKNGAGRGQRREWNWVIGVVMLLADPLPLLHRLPAAVGPARLLGGHGRHQHRRLDPLRRARSIRELLIGGRTIDQADAHPLLRPARHLPARRSWARSSRTTCGAIRKDGGLARVDRVATLREKAAEEPVEDEDLHAARRRPGHGPDDPRREPRGAATSPSTRCPTSSRRAAIAVLGTFAVISVLASLRPLAPRGGGQRRS